MTDEIERVYAYVAYVVGEGPIAREVTERTFEFARRHDGSRTGERLPWLCGIARDLLGVRAQARWREGPVEDLREAVQALDPELREVVALHHGAGLSTPEIAAVLDRTEDDVDVILHRARDALRKEMAALADIPWQKPL